MYEPGLRGETQRRDAARSIVQRLEGRLRRLFKNDAEGFLVFKMRLNRRFPELFDLLIELYGDTYDLFWHVEQQLMTAARAAAARPDHLRSRDHEREQTPEWFLDHRQIGAVAYVDRFAGNLKNVPAALAKLDDLGITYLHLMPLFKRPKGDNDGGYAVSSYRHVHKPLGSMADLRRLADELSAKGVSLCVDFILNHTADDHPWAEAAKQGPCPERDLYFMFEDRSEPDRYSPMLRDIFPDRGGDAFVWRDDVKGPNGGMHVWSTFYPFQWDLNYANPATLTAIAGEMLFLANQGIDILRLDAVPFLWKEKRTVCENLPKAHLVIRALNALSDIAAPALVFKSEAIVHPDDVASYVDPAECQLSYNPLFMVCLWESIATRDARLIRDCLQTRQRTAAGTAWIDYIRGHDDIGWGFANEDCFRLGINPEGHRQFLNAFYTGRHDGSFARGLPFQENPRTGDCRISGTLASLAGLEAALEADESLLVDHAIRRILMMHALIMTVGGIPLLYFGDEIAQLNDYGFLDNPETAGDNRWVHRPAYDWNRLASARNQQDTSESRVFDGIRKLIQLRKAEPALSGSELHPLQPDSPHLIAFQRLNSDRLVTILVNISEHPVRLTNGQLRNMIGTSIHQDRWNDRTIEPEQGLDVEPLGLNWLTPERDVKSCR